MPAGDGTGPAGAGEMTGRGLGYCAGSNVPGFMTGFGMRCGMGVGRGRGPARGMGRGRFGAAAAYRGVQQGPVTQQELDMLKAQAEGLQQVLGDVQLRISEIEDKA